ncbi:MAG: hypothetical protein KBT21_10610, partial [Treponema sp.]|nr:hypothetical protein [Candidatus Treponema merdequi]
SILEGEDIFETNNDIIYITLDKEDNFSRAQFYVGPLYFTLAYFITERVGHFDTYVNIGCFGLKNNWLDFESSARTSITSPLWGTKGNPKPINFINDGFKIVLDINAIYFNMTYPPADQVFSYEDETDEFEITHEELLVSNYVNDSIFTENGFVVNYANKIPVSLGHNYKIIARLDTQGAQYLGSDSKYSFIKQNGVLYQISIDKMFPDAAYDEEVNIIESDFCKRIGGYKIFNTTTYWNAIYNDDSDKVLCSCDDWNGRFFTTSSTLGNATLKSSSRVGHFWDATLSFDDIPNKAISNELNDFLEIANPTYYWANSQYTLHPGTVAFIYSQDTDIGSAPMIQQYKVTSEGFFRDYSETKIFTHNANYQLVPSILFSEFLNSDIINIIQIGSESYELMKYSYAAATPALVYSEIPISIHIDPTEQRFVIQGSLYYISGSSDNRKILNPYDTSEDTYCCDVTGLRYLGYDSEQGYFYSPATGIIYTFNGANKLNAFLEVDKRIPLESGVIGDSKVGIDVTNIPSMNIIAMAFSDGVLIICNGQSIFIDVQGVNIMEAHKEYGLIKINGSYYYFGTNNTIQNLVEDTKDVAVDFNIKSCKIGRSRLENVTCSKHRICIYSDVLNATNKAELTVTLTGLLGRKMFSETLTKTLTQRDLVDNEYQWEFNPKNTKAQYFQTEVSMKNADMLEYWMDINEQTEENLVRN